MHSYIFLCLLALIHSRGCILPSNPFHCDISHDYFPGLPEFNNHQYIKIYGFKYYVQLEITDPDNRTPSTPVPTVYKYTLVQCGCPDPSTTHPIIHVPVNSIGSIEPDTYPMADALLKNNLFVLTIDPRYIATETLVDNLLMRMVRGDKLTFVEFNAEDQSTSLTPELIKSADPEVMFVGYDDIVVLRETVPRVMYWGSSDEITPLARAEWVEIMGIIVGNITGAQKISDEVTTNYNKAKEYTAQIITERPIVFIGVSFNWTNKQHEVKRGWWVPGGNSDQAALIRDGGGTYFHPGTNQTDIFVPYKDGLNFLLSSVYWFDPLWCFSRTEEFIGENFDLAGVPPLKNHKIFGAIRRTGDDLCHTNDAIEGGALHPDYMLIDVIHMLHPEVINSTRHPYQYYTRIVPLKPGSRVVLTDPSTYPINCQYSGWQTWDPCSASCGQGFQIRMRQIKQLPKRGGAMCNAMFDIRECMGACKSTINLTVILIIVGVVAFVVSIFIAWFVGRKTAKQKDSLATDANTIDSEPTPMFLHL